MDERTTMQQFIKLMVLSTLLSVFSSILNAGPWFTGPLLAPAGHTVPRGHTNFELYGIDILTNGRYDQSGTVIHTPLTRSFVANPIITHGFTNWLDVQLILPYVFNSTQGERYNRLSDVSVALGFQLLEQKSRHDHFDFRLLVQETFPTGRFDNLNPAQAGTDATGLGSYQTQIGLNFQHLIQLFGSHYLRTRLILNRNFAGSVRVNGLNSFGGSVKTQGQIAPGAENTGDLAFEFTLNQHWVAVLEGTASTGQATRFNGILNVGSIGNTSVSIGNNKYHERSLAPALEYNFNSNVGLIGGVWFPVRGQNTAHFKTYILALNTYW